MTTDARPERILVCVGPSPRSARVVRAAHRIAAEAGVAWIAAGVGRAGGDREHLEAHLSIAETLGAEVVRLDGRRVADALLACARARGVTRIVLGKPTHPRILDLVKGSLVDDLIRGSGPIQVQVIGADAPEVQVRPAPAGPPVGDYARALLAVVATTALGWVGAGVLAAPDIVLLYLFAISAAAYRSGRGPSLLAAAASVGAYNFFFVPPYHTFAVAESRNLLTFTVMFGVGLAISTFAERTRTEQAVAWDRERRIAGLYALARDLSAAADEAEVVAAAERHAARTFGPARLVDPEVAAEPAEWALPVPAAAGASVLLLRPDRPVDRDDAEAFARQVGLALGRVRLAARAESASLRARTEEMRSALLSTVSHDLRTPLAAITGAATTLLETRVHEGRRHELVEGIHHEAERLERLVGNLLDMTRVASGTLDPKREWVPLDELVGSALHRVARAVAGRAVVTAIDPDLPLLPVDPVLLEQVLVNLFENAARHTPEGTPITLRGRLIAGGVEIEVSDRGPGLPGPPARLFEPFVRGLSGGSGLGLAICRGIVAAHGGTIEGGASEEGGAAFRLRIPVPDQPSAVPVGEP